MNWRLGIDLGANSLGWCAVELDDDGRPFRIIGAGSRIFSDGRDPKSGASLAVDRRAARAMRRRRDRFLQRQAALLKHLTLAGLFPTDEAERAALERADPYALRARALDERLTLHEVGRALFHINQRRGFRSNRKAERRRDDDSGKIRVGVERLQEAMREAGARTLGEYLHQRRASATDPNHVPSVRTRLRAETGEGARGTGYDFYPDRRMLEEEFHHIWEAQTSFHPDTLTPEVEARLFEIVFHQRALRAPKVGTCTLLPGLPRLPKAHPLFQRRRLLEELNALYIVRPGMPPEPLTLAQRDLLYLRLKDRRQATFESLRLRVLKLDPLARFNKESQNRQELKGDEVAAELGAKTRFGTRWAHMDVEAQWRVVSRLLEEEDTAALHAWLIEEWGLTPDQARATAAAHLPQGYGRFGQAATERLIDELRSDVVVYSRAVERAGLGHHSDFRTGEFHAELPYYGTVLERHIMPGTGDPSDPEEMRVGRLTNPTVHIGLNQLRRVANRLIRAHGRPREIAIELARELKLDDERKQELNRRNRLNREAAERRSVKLREIGQADTGANRALLKLWEELNPENVLDRRCVYTGTQISIDMLFSGAVEVDHILPFSATLDDSFGNRLLCMREANRAKRRRTPHDAFSDAPQWEDILARSVRLPREKQWRFAPDALTRFAQDGGFLARHLVDTQYLSLLAREYLAALYPETGEGSSHVWVSPGRLTEMLRRSWGLNSLLPDHNFAGGADQPKNRLDHRHHAIDAAVTAVVDRGLLNRISTEVGRRGLEGGHRLTADLPPPWEEFREELQAAVGDIVVSHRPDHGTAVLAGHAGGATAGRLHNETAYGITGEVDERGNGLVVHRVPWGSLQSAAQVALIRDPELRAAAEAAIRGLDGKALQAALARLPVLGPLPYRGIRRVRLLEPLKVIPIRDRAGRAYKGYKGDSNYRCDVWELKDGRWVAEVVSMFDAHQVDWRSQVRLENPTARKVLKLHQNDLLAIEPEAGQRRLVRVVKFGQNGQVTLAEPHEAGDLKRRNEAKPDFDPFRYFAPTASGLRRVRARKVRVDELGRVMDPGFRGRSDAGSAG